MDLNEG